MIQLDIGKFGSELADFLSIGKRWLFVPGYVYTCNDAKNVFARMTMPGLEANEAIDPLMKMDRLENVLSLKGGTVKTLKIAVASGMMIIDSKDIVTQIQIAREDDPDHVSKLVSYNDLCRKLEEATGSFDTMPICEFDVRCNLMNDALDIANSPKEPIRIETGNSVNVSAIETNQNATLPNIRAEPAVGIGLSMEAQTHLRKVLSKNDAIRIKILHSEDTPFCIFRNARLTVMAGGMVKQDG